MIESYEELVSTAIDIVGTSSQEHKELMGEILQYAKKLENTIDLMQIERERLVCKC